MFFCLKFNLVFLFFIFYFLFRSFDSLTEDLTRLLEDNVKLPGAVRTIYSLDGKKIATLDDIEDGKSYVCSCNNEYFKKVEYSLLSINNLKASNRHSKGYRPFSPIKNGSPIINLSERDSVVYPRIVTLVRNGIKPRKVSVFFSLVFVIFFES